MESDRITREAARLVQYCASTAEIERCAQEIETSVLEHFGAESAVYILERSRCRYERVGQRIGFPASYDVAEALPQRALRSMRNRTCVGLLTLSEDLSPVGESTTSYVGSVLAILGFLYNRLFTKTLLSSSHAPIDFHQPNSAFFDELKLITLVSSGMFAGALRELDTETGALATLFAWNNGSLRGEATSAWDLSPEDAAPSIWKAIELRAPQTFSASDPANQAFFSRNEQSNIISAVVCPVLVGNDLFGTLSFGLPIDYDYSDLEVDGFMVLANATGVAIHNFRRAAAENDEGGRKLRDATIQTALEVAQAARHTAKTVIDTVNMDLLRMHLLAEKVPGQVRNDLKNSVDELSTHIAKITKSLDDIKAATRPPKSELVSYSLASIWREASSLMRGKLNKENISANWEGHDIEVLCYPDQLRQVFLNLVINSIDAFLERRSSGKRLIQCRIDTVVGERVTLRYNDNAGGLDVHKLRIAVAAIDPDPSSPPDPASIIFWKDVTTKGDEGSGWGLYLCRRILDRHKGSIEVVDYRRGLTLKIETSLGFKQD